MPAKKMRKLLATPRKTDKGWFLIFECGHWKYMKTKPRNFKTALCGECR